jgi:hypothetical protein
VRKKVQVLAKAYVLQRKLLDVGANPQVSQEATRGRHSASSAKQKQAQEGKVTVGLLAT